jgi:hypothetical protein
VTLPGPKSPHNRAQTARNLRRSGGMRPLVPGYEELRPVYRRDPGGMLSESLGQTREIMDGDPGA